MLAELWSELSTVYTRRQGVSGIYGNSFEKMLEMIVKST